MTGFLRASKLIAMADGSGIDVSVMTYNMHGMNQGRVLLTEICAKGSVDVILLQEHWLASKALQQFDAISDNYSHVAVSSMDSSLRNAPLTGRPYGGLAIM